MRHRAVRPHTCAFLVALWVLVVMPPPSCAREGIFAKIKKSVKSVMGKDGSASIIVKQPTQVQHERAEVAEAERDRDARERDEGGLTTPSYERRMASTRSSRARSRAESRDPGAVLADPGAVLAARYKRVWADPGAVLAARYKSVWGGARSE